MSHEAHPALATFRVHRDHDASGISGAGVVAEGVQFSDGWVVTHWLDQAPMWEPKTDVWHHKGTGPVTKIHGHGGATRIVWAADEERQRQELAADIIRAFDVPSSFAGREAEMAYYRTELGQRLGGASTEWTRGHRVVEGLGSVPLAVEVSGYLEQFVDAVMPLLAELMDQRDARLNAVGRAYRLAYRWQGAHGSANFLVRAAGAELLDELVDDSVPATEEVVHPAENAQANGTSGVDYAAAAECSAQHHGFPGDHRQCIRAAQHRGDHIDESGFHWSDTVAVYPLIDGTVREFVPASTGCLAEDQGPRTGRIRALRQELEVANAVVADTKRLMERRTNTLRRRAERAEAKRDRWRRRAESAQAANSRVRALAVGEYYGITGRAFLTALDGTVKKGR